jgi:hypothetical protein
VYAGKLTRVVVENDCADFRGCLFEAISTTGTMGGAICFEETAVFSDTHFALTLTDSIFRNIRLYLNGVTDAGGAIWLEASTIQIMRTCASWCRAEEGQAFYINEAEQRPDLQYCSFVDCSTKGDNDAASGALTCDSGVGLGLSCGNFTHCYIAGYSIFKPRYGSGICLWGHNSDSDTITYSTFRGCGGYSTVEVKADSDSRRLTIDSCNFCADDNDNCLIYVERGPLTVTGCYFTQSKANTPNFFSEGSGCVFTITNCFLDRSSLSGASYSGNSGNVFNFDSRTPYISYKNTVYCSADPSPVMTLAATGTSKSRSLTRPCSRSTTAPFTAGIHAWLRSRNHRILRFACVVFLW